MTSTIDKSFRKAAKDAPKAIKRPAPLSLRLSEDERALLEQHAGNQPLGAYIRAQLFGDAASAKRRSFRRPCTDYRILGQVLATLGQSDLASCLCILAAAAEAGELDVDKEIAGKLNAACDDIHEIRLLLITALGLKVGSKP